MAGGAAGGGNICKIRGLLKEFGNVIPIGLHHVRNAVISTLENIKEELPDIILVLMKILLDQLKSLKHLKILCTKPVRKINYLNCPNLLKFFQTKAHAPPKAPTPVLRKARQSSAVLRTRFLSDLLLSPPRRIFTNTLGK
jgi:hypothetical protein